MILKNDVGEGIVNLLNIVGSFASCRQQAGNECTGLGAAADGQERSRFGEGESASWERLETREQAGQRGSRDEGRRPAARWRKAAKTAKQQGKLRRVLIGRGPKRLYVVAGS